MYADGNGLEKRECRDDYRSKLPNAEPNFFIALPRLPTAHRRLACDLPFVQPERGLDRRPLLGWMLAAIGAISTPPLIYDVYAHRAHD
jgi:hypothetical protein